MFMISRFTFQVPAWLIIEQYNKIIGNITLTNLIITPVKLCIKPKACIFSISAPSQPIQIITVECVWW